MKESGISKVIPPVMHRKIPPMSSASAEPPMTDGANPRNSAAISTASPAFKAAIGVAELTPSI